MMYTRFTKAYLWIALLTASALGACGSSSNDEGGGAGAPASMGTGAGSAANPTGGGAAGMGSSNVGSGAAGSSTGGGATDVAGTGAAAGTSGTSNVDGGTVGDMGGGATDGGGGGQMMVPRTDLGQGDGSDVVTIGDSYMNLSAGSGIEFSLEKVSGRDYRNYAVPGTRILTGEIPSQYDAAKAENPDIKTVVMTGGGNDIILDFFGNLLACQGAKTEAELSPACITALDNITAGVDELINKMEADGVQDVVYIGYGFVTNNELGGTIERTKRVQGEKCRDDDPTRTIRCHFVDPSQQLIGYISGDGIHPTVEGYDIVGGMVWQRMQDEGVRR